MEAKGTQVAFVHMGNEEHARQFFAYFKVDDLPRVSDPERHLYRAFGLTDSKIKKDWFRPWLYVRLWQARKFGVGKLAGNGFQMPGAFLIHDGKILQTFRHESVADRPDYIGMAGS